MLKIGVSVFFALLGAPICFAQTPQRPVRGIIVRESELLRPRALSLQMPALPAPAVEPAETVQFTYSVLGSGLFPFVLTGGGRGGVSFADRFLEVGLDAELGGGGPALAGRIGPYLNIAPVPVGVGRRIYLHGEAFVAFLLSRNGARYVQGFLGGAGYRHIPLRRSRPSGTASSEDSTYWFVEASVFYSDTTADPTLVPFLAGGVIYR